MCVAHSGEEYQVKLCTIAGGCIQARDGTTRGSSRITDLLSTPVDTLIVLGVIKHKATPGNRALIELIKKLGARAKRIAFVGARPFIGADAVTVYSKHDNIWTSPGMTSAIDLALALVEEDLGYLSTIEIAPNPVVYMRRYGAQSQVSLMIEFQTRSSRFAELNQWIVDNLHQELSIQQLADRATMSRRSFSRHYAREMGISPAKAVALLRIEAALTVLRDSKESIGAIAERCGFVTEGRMRRTFLQKFGKPPSAFRSKLKFLLREEKSPRSLSDIGLFCARVFCLPRKCPG